MQLSQGATVSMWMRSADTEWLTRKLGDDKESNSSFRIMKVAADKLMELTSKTYELVLRMNNYLVSQSNLERNALEEGLIMKAMIPPLKQLKSS